MTGCMSSEGRKNFNIYQCKVLVVLILPVPSGYEPGPIKYSLLTQFLRHSGILPMMALLISDAAISLSSVAEASLQKAACGVHKRFGASLRGPVNTLQGSFSCTSRAAARMRPCFSACASASSSTRPPRAGRSKNKTCSQQNKINNTE